VPISARSDQQPGRYRHGHRARRLATAAIALVAVFVPSFLLLIGVLPFWDQLRSKSAFQAALRGVNAGVVGLLLAALYQPVWTSAINTPADFALGLAAFAC
jgi:chromate transporter